LGLIAYVGPFVVFLALRWLPVPPVWLSPIRLVVVTATIILVGRRSRLPHPPHHIFGSILVGVAVLAIWIAPDTVWHGYRGFWLFHNSITGVAKSSLPVHLKSNVFFITTRVVESAVVIPIVEELFWRGWLMRWLIRPDFESVPLGTYTLLSFWATALLFASEHGPYWDVGLLAGVVYNWWMVRTRSLANCMIAHGVTNGLLAAYVLIFDQWQYWM